MSCSDDDDDVGSGIRPTPEAWMNIAKPTEHDVLCGRGGGTNNHPGNVKFRLLINDYKLRYLAASKVDKPKVARDVVDAWRSLNPPGRFLARKGDSKKGPGSVKADGNVWYDVGDKKAREKASQCLRERTPDVLPYVREMRRQQDVLTGQGLLMVEQQMRLRNEAGVQGINMGMHVNANLNANASGGMMNGPVNAGNGQHPSIQDMLASMNGIDGYNNNNNPSIAQSILSSMSPTMSEPDINNAFSVEHFFTHGFQNAPPPSSYSATADDPLSLQQMSQDPHRWDQAGFSVDLQAMPPPLQVYSNPPTLDFDRLGLETGFAVTPDLVGSSTLQGVQQGLQDELTLLEEYMESMQGLKAYHSEHERTNDLLSMQTNSWVKSFHSIENSKNGDLTLDDSAGSFGLDVAKELEKEIEKEVRYEVVKTELPKGVVVAKEKVRNTKLDFHSIDKSRSLSKQTSTRTHLSAATQKSAMSLVSTRSAQSGMSGLSMLSGMSEASRGSKMSANRNQASSLSMMSDFTELTDVSEGLKSLDLNSRR